MELVHDIRSYIKDLSRPLADKLHLQLLPDFADVIVLSSLLFFVVHHILSPVISRALFPVAYGKASKKTRNNWDAHVVSLVHAALIVAMSSHFLNIPNLDMDRAFGYHNGSSFVMAIACGYFIWDAIEAIVHYTDIGFVLHGCACLSVFLLGSVQKRPFAHYYGVRFLFWEVSTIFLNIHWFLDKTGRTGSTLQLVNGAVLLVTFSSVRLIWGSMMSYDFLMTLRNVFGQVPFLYTAVYGSGNVLLNVLNWFWFAKMVSALRKRFTDKTHDGADPPKANGIRDKDF
ncbi:hypothetical protein ID866_3885 [Astraeus odoratus]|nr:hypothetical protein ID866_3885 [Astraeus odoratus]